MDNQHKHIKGYRDLSKDEIDAINRAKDMAERVGEFVEEMRGLNSDTANHAIDMRWLSIAQTDLQKGFMALVRSIAQPTTF
ncbi:MAG: hypothetical protein DI569_12865 [Sphingopyxis macrogoltabida]|uniref:Acb2/Tad1 hairpin domain-containing protein n=1 Tax=Sphingopyxis macrogoltabida TaxID=33050 RepID=A0A2W5KVU7_SPHMC|nr:MAG: hypothetical protein DI569_12865 [Sphingopyxis macrogoltabida]